MSAIATISILPADILPELQEISHVGELQAAVDVKQIGTLVFKYSGWILATLLPVLSAEYGIDLMRAHRDLSANLSRRLAASVFVFTDEERSQYLFRLAQEHFSSDALQQSFEVFNATNADGVGEPMLDGIRFLRAGLAQLDSSKIAVLLIA